MSERKVLNKYYPPDFDPAAIQRRRGLGPRQQVVRLMAPFSMRCNSCGEYIYKGKKFNARKEDSKETYYSIKIYRFYIKCTRCSAEITFKTDPKNTDYQAEHGASRNFEPWREETDTEPIDKLARLEEEENNPMAELENKTVDAKREMEILDQLQEIRTRNARFERTKLDEERVLQTVSSRVDTVDDEALAKSALDDEQRRQEEEDEEQVRRIFARGAVPSIELNETPTADPAAPLAGPSGTTPDEEDADEGLILPPKPKPEIVVKRKLDLIEPDAQTLLSSDARAFVAKVDFSARPVLKKKQKGPNAMAAKLGIKLNK
ncbi:uncharacterized protein L969DRAFT_51644 [Mixia osmundae IAM 14324]|uniref:Splicing factor YJU2 n=1 Tax=Mixia osmundae (strain CBS 9802 / IAM 14324 / JCM 22182 / KY 12970) TaxID=764103 RepID=G7DWP0_MIXOS|nr:uncharacterized protein L969DRAFT_51644 [Mixia osmundae IAM 14324]KEI38042.1 hypothetical protein L969DRAFT_51644 [Mixia osmundae IAM 14324]GAA95152.1 hypothetical protein E5Q_01807 [Mixia osmundae IAM 14324]